MIRLGSWRVGALWAGVWFFLAWAGQIQAQNSQSQAVEKLVDERLKAYFESPAFDKVVDQAIERYVTRQQEEAARKKREAEEAAMKHVAPVDPKTDFIKGDLKAKYTLIEYSDFECPFCKSFHHNVQAFMKKHPDVNWVYRHFPLSFHNPGAQKQAEAAECAGDLGGRDAFWAYTDKIFERTRSNGKGFPVANLVPLADEIGLDPREFQACLESGKFRDRVRAQQENGVAAGVTGTPGSFLVNNETGKMAPINGALSPDRLEQVLQSIQ